MIKSLAVLILFCVSVSAAQAQDTYEKKVHQYLEATGAMKGFKVAMKGMMDAFKKSKSDIPSDVWDELEKEFLGTTLDDLVNLLAPIYKQHLSEADLDDVIKFYKSPVGMKMAEKTPIITQQSMQAGMEWGQKLGAKVAERLKEKGYN
jgi:hypothetical protein